MSFVTSTRFLEYFGLETLEELPPLEDEEQPEQADLFFRELDQDEE
jgi:segregation and condensation protein B